MGTISLSNSSDRINPTPDKKIENTNAKAYLSNGKKLDTFHNMFNKDAFENSANIQSLKNERINILKNELGDGIPNSIYQEYVADAKSFGKSLEEAKVDIRQKNNEQMSDNAKANKQKPKEENFDIKYSQVKLKRENEGMRVGGADKQDKLTPDKFVNEQKKDYDFIKDLYKNNGISKDNGEVGRFDNDVERDKRNKVFDQKRPKPHDENAELTDVEYYKDCYIPEMEERLSTLSKDEPIYASELAEKFLKVRSEELGYEQKLIEDYMVKLDSDAVWDTVKEVSSDGEKEFGKNKWDNMSYEKQKAYALRSKNKNKLAKCKLKQYVNATKVLDAYNNRYEEGYFKKEYSLNDIVRMKVDKSCGEKMYEGIPREYINYLPQADEFIADDRIVKWTKDLFVDNEEIQRCNNLNELAQTLYNKRPSIDLVSFQNADLSTFNIVSTGNFGNVKGNLRTAGPFQVPEYMLEKFAKKYPDYCEMKDGKIEIKDMEMFGNYALSGVNLEKEYGAYEVQTKVPFRHDTIAMPSVENGSAYMAYFVSGGKLLNGDTEVTIVPVENVVGRYIDIDEKGKEGNDNPYGINFMFYKKDER